MIEFKNITLIQNHQSILKDFNLSIQAKERLVIVGASGTGKTTVLRLIAGFITPDQGEIIIDEQIVTQNHKIIIPPNKREVGILFQDLALWPHLTVEGNIEFGLKIYKVDKAAQKQK